MFTPSVVYLTLGSTRRC